MNKGLKWKIAAGFILVFLAGAMTGAWLWSAYIHTNLATPPHAEMLAHHMEDHLRTELGLTPEQFAKVVPVIERSARELVAVRTESERRVGVIMRETREKMAPTLTPEQVTKLNEMDARRQRRAERHGGLPPHHPPHPPE